MKIRWSKPEKAPRSWAVQGAPVSYAILKGHTGRLMLLSSKKISTFWTFMDTETEISSFLHAYDWKDAKEQSAYKIQQALK